MPWAMENPPAQFGGPGTTPLEDTSGAHQKYARCQQGDRNDTCHGGMQGGDAQLPPRVAMLAQSMNGGQGPSSMLEVTQLYAMANMSKQNQSEDSGDQAGHKAFRRMAQIRERVIKRPHGVINDYLGEAIDKMGLEPGDPWQLWQFTHKLAFGKNKGLLRLHYHVSHALTYSLRGQTLISQAYMVQILRALYQLSLDNGSWSTAALLLPKADPVFRELFGGTQEELEAAASYQKALKEMRGGAPKPESGAGTGEGAADGKNNKKGGKNAKKDDEDKTGF